MILGKGMTMMENAGVWNYWFNELYLKLWHWQLKSISNSIKILCIFFSFFAPWPCYNGMINVQGESHTTPLCWQSGTNDVGALNPLYQGVSHSCSGPARVTQRICVYLVRNFSFFLLKGPFSRWSRRPLSLSCNTCRQCDIILCSLLTVHILFS